MFSSDKNIETISQLVQTLKHYIGLQQEYVKLDVIEKSVRILTALIMTLILSTLFLIMVIYLSFALAYALEPLVGDVAAFAIVAGIYLVVLALLIVFRHQWIEKPLVKFLTDILMSK
ncbi:MAG: phage holin family protein [Prevotella sp.]|jgi:polyferredoxin